MDIKDFKHKYLHPIKIFFYDTEISLFGAWRFFLKQQKQQERQMLKEKYNEQTNSNLQPKNEIVFTCNGFIWHGGLADRLKGIVSVYEWCKNNGKTFKINFCHPFKLKDYLVPNHYDWIIDDVQYNKKVSIPKICLTENRACGKKEIQDNYINLFQGWLDKNLNNPGKQIHVYTNTRIGERNFSSLFNELFKPSKILQKEIEWNLNKINGKYISISFRFTTIMGDFTDCTGREYPEEEKIKLMENCAKAINEIRKTAPAHDKVLITADSERFLDYVKNNVNNIYIIPGKVGHIDYVCNNDVNMKTFLDFMLISKAEKAYLVKNKDMYNSQFAAIAAMVNNKAFEVINI